MSKDLINYKGISVKRNLYPIIKYIEDVEKYREELGTLSSSWDIFALLGQLGDINIDIGKTKENFLNLTSTLLNHLSEETIKKVTAEMNFKAQVAIDIVIRNLFERTADIGFLATDDDIRDFIKHHISKYNKESNTYTEQIKKRFQEYVAKYSVYFDIVLSDTNGRILSRLDDNTPGDFIDKKFINKVLNTSEEYLETYEHHDFLPKLNRSLVYSFKVTESNDPNSETIGVLSLCFKFIDEMREVFNNLVDVSNKECLVLLDENGYVIASNDRNHVPWNVKLPIVTDEPYKVISFSGRNYIAKSCETKGYQGFNGLKWYGHIMIPLEYAFLSDVLNNVKFDDNVVESMMNNENHFSNDLKEVFKKSKTIQDNLNRVIWNGNIVQSKQNSSNREFSKSLLNEIGITGIKANSSLNNLTQTILSSILKDSEFLSSLAIDIMDRNLYERANDCRWWALTSYFREAFDDYESLTYKEKEISSILKYINDLYTVYTNLMVFDKDGKIIAVSNDKEKFLVGKVLNQNWVNDTMNLDNTQRYCVSKFEKTNLYGNESTYIYCAGIRSLKNEAIVNGGIAIVFDSKPQFQAMLEDSLPKDVNGVFGFFTNRDKTIISSTNSSYEIGSKLNIENKFFEIKNGEKISEIILIKNKYYAIGVRCSYGYREYKSELDDYTNDVLSFVFIYIGNKVDRLKYSNDDKEKFMKLSSNKKKNDNSLELATFYLGKKFLAIESENVIESVGIDELEESIEMDKENHFKGMVLHKNRLISVLDIRDFINEEISNDDVNTIVLFEYDKNNKTHCVGILVSSLENISIVDRSKIQNIESHFLGSGTLIKSLVDINDYDNSKVAMLLDIKKIDENLTENL